MPFHANMVFRLSTVLMPLALGACGGKSKTVATPIGVTGTSLSSTSSCTATNCPKAVAGFGANMVPGGAFAGWVGESVTWKVTGIDENSKNPDGLTSARRMTVLFDKFREDFSISPEVGDDLGTEASIEWKPKTEMSGTFDVIVRDAELCEKEKSKSYCNSHKFLTAYDTRFEDLDWEIKDRDKLEEEVASGVVDGEVTVSDPNCTGAASPTTDGDIKKKVLGSFIQMLTNPGAILQTGMTMFSGGGAVAPADPTPC